MFEATGKLIYDPHARIKQDPWWLILKADEGIIDYYKHWINKEIALDFGGINRVPIRFEKTVWGSHISVNRGTKPPKKNLWRKHQGENIKFTYSNRIYRVHWFFCVDAYSKRLEDIREEMGLSRIPPYGYHITIGRISKQFVQEQSAKFGKTIIC